MNSDARTGPHKHGLDNEQAMAAGSTFVVIPAAGHSRRMGQPKLLLPLGDRPIIGHLLETLRRAGLERIVVVVRASDQELERAIVKFGGIPVLAEDPPDMLSSIRFGLNWIAKHWDPQPHDSWLLIPADHPTLDSRIVTTVIGYESPEPETIVIPTGSGRRGHPTRLPWSVSDQLDTIPAGHGLNWLVRNGEFSVSEVEVAGDSAFTDLDTPADYQRLLKRWSSDAT